MNSELIDCPKCKGTGVETDENGVQYDDVCPFCEGEKLVEADYVPAFPFGQRRYAR